MATTKQTFDYSAFEPKNPNSLRDFLDDATLKFLDYRGIDFDKTLLQQMSKVKPNTEFLPIIGPYGITPTSVALPRDLCHKLGFWHNAVIVIVLKDNLVGVQTRDPSKEKFGGLMDPGIAGHMTTDNITPSNAGFAEFAELNVTLPAKIQLRHFMPLQGFLDRRIILPDTDKYMIENQFYYTFYIDITEFPEIEITEKSFVDGEVSKFEWMSIPSIMKSLQTSPDRWHPRQQWKDLLANIPKIR